MACCIYVAMIITNILEVFRRLKSLLNSAPKDAEAASQQPLRHRLLLPAAVIAALSVGLYQWHSNSIDRSEPAVTTAAD